MLPKLQGQRLRQEVQRAVRHRQRQGEPAVLLRRPRPARVQPDVAGAAQPVRPDAARQRRRARRDGLAGGERQRRPARAVARPTTCPARPGVVVTPQGRSRRGGSTRRSSSTPPARTRCCRKKLGIRKGDPKLRKASLFAHYKGCRRDPGKNGGATLVLSTQAERRLVLVHPAAGRRHERRRRRRPRPADVEQARARPSRRSTRRSPTAPACSRRMTDAERVGDVHVLSDFSYRASRCAGDGWVLVGDAFGFLDPMYSSGVFLALKSGEMAADAINEAFERSDFSDACSSASGATTLSDGMQTIRKLVYAFYTPDFSLRPVRQGVPAAQGRRDGRPRRRRVPAGGGRAVQADGHDGPDPREHPAGEARRRRSEHATTADAGRMNCARVRADDRRLAIAHRIHLLIRRVQFAETDMAGIVHFSNYFRWMEEVEHAFFRSLGLSVVDAARAACDIGWPRVNVACEFYGPVRFEDEVELRLRVDEGRREVAQLRGRLPRSAASASRSARRTSVCCEHAPDGPNAVDPDPRRHPGEARPAAR